MQPNAAEGSPEYFVHRSPESEGWHFLDVVYLQLVRLLPEEFLHLEEIL